MVCSDDIRLHKRTFFTLGHLFPSLQIDCKVIIFIHKKAETVAWFVGNILRHIKVSGIVTCRLPACSPSICWALTMNYSFGSLQIIDSGSAGPVDDGLLVHVGFVLIFHISHMESTGCNVSRKGNILQFRFNNFQCICSDYHTLCITSRCSSANSSTLWPLPLLSYKANRSCVATTTGLQICCVMLLRESVSLAWTTSNTRAHAFRLQRLTVCAACFLTARTEHCSRPCDCDSVARNRRLNSRTNTILLSHSYT